MLQTGLYDGLSEILKRSESFGFLSHQSESQRIKPLVTTGINQLPDSTRGSDEIRTSCCLQNQIEVLKVKHLRNYLPALYLIS